MVGRKAAAAYAEESAEVEVLYANLEKLNGLTKKIQGSLNRLDTSRTNVDSAIGPIYGNTRKLQITHRIIERLKAPLENKDQEESIIRSDPKRVGVPEYVASLERAERALKGLKSTNLSVNQTAIKEMGALVNYGNRQLEEVFKQQLLTIDMNQIEPLQYVVKQKPFPIIPDANMPELRFINKYMARAGSRAFNNGTEFSTMRVFGQVRGNYVSTSLTTSAAATMSTARKLNSEALYRKGTCGIGTYCAALEGMLLAEFDNIKRAFAPEDWTRALLSIARPALSDFGKTLRDLNTHVQTHLLTDCFLAYEILDLVSAMARRLETVTSELKHAIMDILQPIHETAKTSLSRLIEDNKLKVQSLQVLPLDGGAVPISADIVARLSTLIDYSGGPLGTIMQNLEGKWLAAPPSSSASPSIRSFDTNSAQETAQLFAKYCEDTLENLINQLDNRARLLHKTSSVQAVFMCNNVILMETQIRNSELNSILSYLQPKLDLWKTRYAKLYLAPWNACGSMLLDVTHTNRSSRPNSSGVPDSSSIVKGLSTKEKDGIKEKFRNFNGTFDELIAKHKTYKMEIPVRTLLGRDISKVIQPLYDRFWDRYHEIDKGKGKYVRYSKAELSVILANFML
jgi:exocyst complex protein 7